MPVPSLIVMSVTTRELWQGVHHTHVQVAVVGQTRDGAGMKRGQVGSLEPEMGTEFLRNKG